VVSPFRIPLTPAREVIFCVSPPPDETDETLFPPPSRADTADVFHSPLLEDKVKSFLISTV